MEDSVQFVDTLGLSFLEFSGNHPERLIELFEKMGFVKTGQIAAKSSDLYTQGDIYFISNPSNGGNAEKFREVHGRGACAMGFKVHDSQKAFELAVSLGAEPVELADYDIPAIHGVGASIIYLVDEEKERALFDLFGHNPDDSTVAKAHLIEVDHLTHNLKRGQLAKWIAFYEKVFGFLRVRHFEIEGKKTGLFSEVVASRCGRLKIPLNESKDDESQIEEFIKEYKGEGIQHIALATTDIIDTVVKLKEQGIPFQDTPDTYYELIDSRLPDHGENVEKLHELKILVDGGPAQGGGKLLQIFTQNSIGPIFFEFIQRKGNEGFGEGNFQALFESIELDQMRCGVI